MFVVAGPPGSGKSTAFPVSGFGVDFFNADSRAAALNGGSYIDIPHVMRGQVNQLFEEFVMDHIERRVSCAFETTLRTGITFGQALARNKRVSPWKCDTWHLRRSGCSALFVSRH
jgi:predicted ABC-type ATPase